MVCFFKTNIPILGNFSRVLSLLGWYIFWPFNIFCGHLLNFVAIWYILWRLGIFYGHLVCFSRFGMMYQGKSGNPDCNDKWSEPLPWVSFLKVARHYLCAYGKVRD
jgi:hypothetical protein